MAWSPENPAVSKQTVDGDVRLIRHFQYPFELSAEKPHTVVVAYLRAVRGLLKLSPQAIEHLANTIPARPDEEGSPSSEGGLRLRWRPAFSLRVEGDEGAACDEGRKYQSDDEGEKNEESVVVKIQQTRAVASKTGREGCDVEFAGLRALVHHDPARPQDWRIVGITSTLIHGEIDVVGLVPDAGLVDRATVNNILDQFGLPGEVGTRFIAGLPRPFLHQYRPGASSAAPLPAPLSARAELIPGRYYVANYIRAVPGRGTDHELPGHHLVFRRSEDPDENLTPLQVQVLIAHAAPTNETAFGLAFDADPISATGDSRLRRNSSPAVLDQRRSTVEFELHRPDNGKEWGLGGDNVRIYDGSGTEVPKHWGWLGIKPPTQPAPYFAFSSRTNDFAAVNAYYHLHRMFALLKAFGLPFKKFPMGHELPVPVIHRARLHPGPCSDGKCVNAQIRQLPDDSDSDLTKTRTVLFAFALADLARNPGSPDHPVEPLGIACDVRIIWHEFCHALISASTNFLEFPFAHSAGDALAAINGDPESRLATGAAMYRHRGLTFPWGTTPTRRHDRTAADDWSWPSPLGEAGGYEDDIRDMFGYAREQVLSSTLFRLYRSIGGDAMRSANEPDRVARQAAALYATYLIARAICSLGPKMTVPARDAEAFAMSLAEADIGTQTLTLPCDWIGDTDHTVTGGAVHKVIRWAFEKQGLFQTDQPPLNDGSGRPEPIDVFLEDGRNGEYAYAAQWQASADAIWVNRDGDPRRGDEPPAAGEENFVFVRVKNRGHQPAGNVAVTAYSAPKGRDEIWPDPSHWTKLDLHEGAEPCQTQDSAEDDLVFGPFVWRPLYPWLYSILVLIEAEGDYSNLNPDTKLPCAERQIKLAAVVPHDNNIGLRTILVPNAKRSVPICRDEAVT